MRLMLKLCTGTKPTSDNLAKSLRNLLINTKMSYYAVAKGRKGGIFSTWAECESQVKGFSGARYKKFKTQDEAVQFISENGVSVTNFAAKVSKPVKKHQNITSNYNKKPNGFNSFKTSIASVNKTATSLKKPNTTKTVTSKPVTLKSSDDDISDEDLPHQNFINDLITKEINKVERKVRAVKKSVDKIYAGPSKAATSMSNGKTQRRTIMTDALKRQSNSTKDGPSRKKRKISNIEFETDENDFVQVYTDGSCIGNGTSSARAGLGVFFGDDHPLNLCSPVSGRATNNCGEIQAATKAIRLAHQSGVRKLQINTDSKFLINSVTQWMKGWKRKGWKLASGEPVKNEIDFKELDSVLSMLDVKFNYVKAHVGIHGNEMADKLANEGAALYKQK